MVSKKKTIALAALAVLVFVLAFACYKWHGNKMRRVDAGTARPTFPYSDYSQEELNKLYPQYVENNAPTIQTPEETHRKFVEALKKGDFEEAVECCFLEERRVEMRKMLQGIKDKGQLALMISDLREIKPDLVFENKATYTYLGTYKGMKIGNSINFIKTSQGIWLIESL